MCFPRPLGSLKMLPVPDLEEDLDFLEQGEDEDEPGPGNLAEDPGADAQEESLRFFSQQSGFRV